MMKQMELAPGVRLHAIQTDRFKTGCFSVNFIQPLRRETAAVNALLPSVLLRGCRQYPDMTAISSRLDQLYGASIGTLVRKKGEVQTIGLFADFLEDRFCEEPIFRSMMDFVCQLLSEPCMEDGGFVEAYTEGERQNLTNAIESLINDKRTYAQARLLKHMCAEEAFSVPRLGEAETLCAVTGKDLYRRYEQLIRESELELFYLGRQSCEEVAEALTPLVRILPSGNRTKAVTEMPGRMPQNPRFVEEALNVTQGKLSIGLRTEIRGGDPQYPALMVANAIFGGGMNSKLFLKIREEQSLCYYASSVLDKFKGIMLVDSGIEFDHYQLALDGILNQLQCCKNGEITKEELEAARTYLMTSFRIAMDSPGRLDDYTIGQAIAGLDGTMEDMMNSIASVTMEQVVEAARTLETDTVYFLKGVEG